MIQLTANTAMNAESVVKLERGCVSIAPVFSQTHSQIEWQKNRSKAKSLQLIVPNVVKEGIGIPQLVKFVEQITEPLVSRVKPNQKNDLWLYGYKTQDFSRRRTSWVIIDFLDALARMISGNRRHLRQRKYPVGHPVDNWSISEAAAEASASWSQITANPGTKIHLFRK
ncbi:MAG: hypothetical protein IPP19_08745 [Verrucomicrobia bacterium]|nr:hypothetical protein [Verrucomicrobiota bacterium]